jgi:hypothetical protein
MSGTTTRVTPHYVIDASKPWHIAWWAQRFDATEEALTEAIAAVGADAGAVEDYLRAKAAAEPRAATVIPIESARSSA